MISRIGPRVWDRIGPGIGAKYWDDPAKKESGALCFSAIDRAASSSAWLSVTMFLMSGTFATIASIAAVLDPIVLEDGRAMMVLILLLALAFVAAWKLVDDIRWTQLAGTMAADGVCDDLFYDDSDEDDEDGEDEQPEETEDEPEHDDEDEDNVVPFADDDWGTVR